MLKYQNNTFNEFIFSLKDITIMNFQETRFFAEFVLFYNYGFTFTIKHMIYILSYNYCLIEGE